MAYTENTDLPLSLTQIRWMQLLPMQKVIYSKSIL